MSNDPRDAPWSETELDYMGAHYPEFLAEPTGGQRFATISRREALALEARFPSMLRPEPAPPPSGATQEESDLAARYPTMR